jgi:hypothetical protein
MVCGWILKPDLWAHSPYACSTCTALDHREEFKIIVVIKRKKYSGERLSQTEAPTFSATGQASDRHRIDEQTN